MNWEHRRKLKIGVLFLVFGLIGAVLFTVLNKFSTQIAPDATESLQD